MKKKKISYLTTFCVIPFYSYIFTVVSHGFDTPPPGSYFDFARRVASEPAHDPALLPRAPDAEEGSLAASPSTRRGHPGVDQSVSLRSQVAVLFIYLYSSAVLVPGSRYLLRFLPDCPVHDLKFSFS